MISKIIFFAIKRNILCKWFEPRCIIISSCVIFPVKLTNQFQRTRLLANTAHLTLKVTSTQVVETSVTNNGSELPLARTITLDELEIYVVNENIPSAIHYFVCNYKRSNEIDWVDAFQPVVLVLIYRSPLMQITPLHKTIA